MAILAWILASVAIGAITLFAARAVAPAWAANTNETATVVVAEVYAILIATLYWVFGGSKGAWSVLRVRLVPGRAFAIAFVAVAASIVLEDVGYLGVGAGDALVGSYLRLGTDGGRLGVIGPLTTTLSLGRACLLAPIGEELLFRGAVYGWSRRWLSAWPAIVVNAVAWGAVSAALNGSAGFALLPLAIISGLVLTWIRERTNSTLPGIAVHTVHNTAIVVAIYLLTGWR